ncbi:MAG: ATP-binding protein, partial [Myxococcota bacterium]|nr:ATP-binding protein [Myxococcota bacterium]
ILRNAVEISPPNQPVLLQLSLEDHGVLFEIKDSGCGMRADTLQRAGEPFFTTRPEKGMGLGLFVARALIERMGGQLTLHSEVGQGTEARVWLPLSLRERVS